MNVALQDWLFYATGALVGLLGITITTLALFKDRAKGRRRCPKCWYDMSGVPTVQCPECGKTAKAEKKFFKTRRRWGRFAVSLFVLTIGAGLVLTPAIQQRGWPSVVPTPILNLAIDLAGEDVRDAAYKKMNPAFSPQASLISRWERLLAARACLDQIRDVLADDDNNIVPWGAFTLSSLGPEAKVAVPGLIDLIESNHEHRVRSTLIQVLAVLSGDVHAAADGVIQLLRSEPDFRFRVMIVQLLAMPSGAASFFTVRTSLPVHSARICRVLSDLAHNDPSTEVRIAAIKTLEAGNTQKEARVLAGLVIEGEGVTERAAAADALLRMGPVAEEVSQEIIQSFRDEFPQATLLTVDLLARLGWPASGALGDLLTNEKLKIRRAAAGALDLMGPGAAGATEQLIKALADDDESVGYLCVKSLGHIGPQAEPGLDHLIERIDTAKPRYIRLAAMEAALSIAPTDKRVTAAAIKLLADADDTVRFTGIDALRRIGPAAHEAIPTLEEIAQTEPKELRYNAMMALYAIRDKP